MAASGLTRRAGRPWNHHVVAGANHAFYSLTWENEVMDTSLSWLEEQALTRVQGLAVC